jgi:hypothetical protein
LISFKRLKQGGIYIVAILVPNDVAGSNMRPRRRCERCRLACQRSRLPSEDKHHLEAI